MTQRHFIGGYFRYQPAQVGRFLGGHPAMLIQSDRFIRHDGHLDLDEVIWNVGRCAAERFVTKTRLRIKAFSFIVSAEA
jgi:hypothetical protein